MLVMQKEIVVSLSDLKYISIKCEKCDTTLTLDMAIEKFALKCPVRCPGCNYDYDSAIPHNVAAFQLAYTAISPRADRVSFRGVSERSEG